MNRSSPFHTFAVLILLFFPLQISCAPANSAASSHYFLGQKISTPNPPILLPPPETAVITPPAINLIKDKRLKTAVFNSISAREAFRTTIDPDASYHLPIAGEMNVDWIISNFVDHNWEAYQTLDYQNGQMSYDGHTGTDFLLPDLAKMETGVAVLASRAGVVIDLHNSAVDAADVGVESNFITIEHSDGSKALYQHLQQGSIQISLGDLVSVGQKIGLVGISGNSLNPHLHFEVRSANGRLIDIFAEGLTAFNYPYPEHAFVFQAGITQLTDTAIQHDMFRVTPDSLTAVARNALPTFWYKAVNVQQGDQLHTILIHPDGTQQDLFTLHASHHQSVASWYIYTAPLPPGWYSIWYYFNTDPANRNSLSFQVLP